MTEKDLTLLKSAIESIQVLMEKNQKDYTDAKFQQLQMTFEQLKEAVANRIEHGEDLQDKKDFYSGQSFKQLSDKVVEYSKSYDKRLSSLEDLQVSIEKIQNLITKELKNSGFVTGEAVENKITRMSERKWAERAIYVVFFLTLLVSGITGYINIKSRVDSHLTYTEQHDKIIQDRIEKLEKE